jgi:hypothetical protein
VVAVNDMFNDEPSGPTGSTPTDEHLAMTALLTRVLLEVARRRQEELPGLTESCQDNVLVLCGGTTRRVHGWFQPDAWRYGNQPVHEVFFNADWGDADPQISEAEHVLVTIAHEAAHAYAQVHDIKDTSRDGRYHNHRFAKIALAIGLQIEPDPMIGHRTPGLSARGRLDYADLLAMLDDGLTLAREPRRTKVNPDGDGETENGQLDDSPESTTSSAKYVFASCRCQAGRGRNVTIRVATGSWRPGVIQCGACGAAFEESPTTP